MKLSFGFEKNDIGLVSVSPLNRVFGLNGKI